MYFKINDFTSEELGVNPNSDYFTPMENIPPGLPLCVRCQRYCHVICIETQNSILVTRSFSRMAECIWYPKLTSIFKSKQMITVTKVLSSPILLLPRLLYQKARIFACDLGCCCVVLQDFIYELWYFLFYLPNQIIKSKILCAVSAKLLKYEQ